MKADCGPPRLTRWLPICELGEVPESPAQHSEQLWVVGDSRAGSQLYGRYCAGCHGADGEGTQAPALNNKAFLAAASDDYLVQTIGKGRRGTEMLGFSGGSPIRPALSDKDIESLIAFLRQWSTPQQVQPAADNDKEL